MANFGELNEKKVTQVAARFLSSAKRRLPYMTLLKLMYIADREALKQWGMPITNDRYVSMKLGPVLSGVYELLVVPSETPTFWHRHVSAPQKYDVTLIDDPGDDQLSDAEEQLIDHVFEEYGKLTQWQLSDLTHEFEEWQDPEGSSLPIGINEILRAVGVDDREAERIVRDLKGFGKMQALSKK